MLISAFKKMLLQLLHRLAAAGLYLFDKKEYLNRQSSPAGLFHQLGNKDTYRITSEIDSYRCCVDVLQDRQSVDWRAER